MLVAANYYVFAASVVQGPVDVEPGYTSSMKVTGIMLALKNN